MGVYITEQMSHQYNIIYIIYFHIYKYMRYIHTSTDVIDVTYNMCMYTSNI